MKHWTHTGAYVAAFALLAVAVANLFLGIGWQAVAGAGLAVGLLASLRALEHFSDVRAALAVTADVDALKAKVSALEEGQRKVDEKAQAAIAGVTEVKSRRPAPGGY